MTAPGRQDRRELPIGRRVAQLRVRRGMSQQVLADRVGRSKSWVDKVERGVRTLDRLSVIETVAAALGVAPGVLTGRKVQRAASTDASAAVEQIRAALARYDTTDGDQPPSAAEFDRQVGYAWTAYRHAHHHQVLRLLPGLLAAARHPEPAGVDVLVRLYQLVAQMLVKLGEPQLAWLAADRAMTTAAGHPQRTARAAVPLTQALRALGRGRLAVAVATVAVRRLETASDREPATGDLALAGTLLTEAALAAAGCTEGTATDELTDRAARLAACAGRPPEDGSGFGPVVVDLARALIAARLGDNHLAVALHQRATRGEGWQRLPAEHRAAHLVDISRAHLDLGDHQAAGRALVTAHRIAPAEIGLRTTAHAMLAAVLRAGPSPADLTRLATTIGLARP